MYLFLEIELKLRDCVIERNLHPKLLEGFPSCAWLQVGYNLVIMRQTASLVFNSIMIERHAALFSYMVVVQALDSITALT